MLDPRSESKTGCMILAGLVMIPIGLVLFFMMFAGGAARGAMTGGSDVGLWAIAGFGLMLIFGGAALSLYGLMSGLRAVKNQKKGGEISVVRGCTVLARFAINHLGEMIFNPSDHDPDEVRFFVRLSLPNDRRAEFRCGEEVFGQCGEGMYGTATFNGDWLGSFVAEPKPQEQPGTPSR